MIHSIETLPIVLFVKIAETNNLQLLTDEKIGIERLGEIWKEITEQYYKYEDNKTNVKLEQLRVKLIKEQGKYYTIICALEVLKYGSNDDILKILESFGYSIVGDYWEGLDKVFNQVENLKNKIDSINEEIEKYSGNNDDANETNIYEILTNLSLGLEIPFKTNEITTIEYIFYRKALLRKIKANNKKK